MRAPIASPPPIDAMLGKLLSQFQKPKNDHPLGSDASVDRLIAGIPVGDPARVLVDTDHWLDDIGRFHADIGAAATLRAALRLDALAAGARTLLLARYLIPGQREYLSETVWGALDKNLRYVQDAYGQCFDALLKEPAGAADKAALAAAASRAMAAWMERKKLYRFRYHMPAGNIWQEAHRLLAAAVQFNVVTEATAAPEGGPARSAIQYYLAGLYFELAPTANLVPQQIEVLQRLLAAQADKLEFLSKQAVASTHCIDVGATAGPQRLGPQTAAGPHVRYLSCRYLRSPVSRLAAELETTDQPPEWIASAGCSADLARQLMAALTAHWFGPSPRRRNVRHETSAELRVVFGFALARRMIACSDFAIRGKSPRYEGAELESLFENIHFGRVEPAAGAEDARPEVVRILNPLSVLEKLELGGDRKMTETWQQVDTNHGGLGALVPALRGKHRIGSLICLRYADGLVWHLAIIRRIGRNAGGQATVGLEKLDWPSFCALVKPLGGNAPSAWTEAVDHGGHGYTDAIVTCHGGDQMILPRDMYAEGIDFEVVTAEGKRSVRFVELIERGDDFDRIRFADAA